MMEKIKQKMEMIDNFFFRDVKNDLTFYKIKIVKFFLPNVNFL